MDGRAISMINVGIVYYKNEKDLLRCLQSFVRHYPRLQELEFIIVNNEAPHTLPGSIEFFCHTQGLQLVTCDNSRNNIASARNLLLQKARHDFIYFTDPDCEQTADLAWQFHQQLHDKKEVAGVGGGNRPPESETHAFYQTLHLMRTHFFGNFNSNQMKDFAPDQTDVGHLSTCNVLYRREALESIGGFDDRLHIVGEDLDLSLRLRHKGWRLLHASQSDVLHYHQPLLGIWIQKVFRYGFAQTKILSINAGILKTHRLLPLVLFASVILLALSPQKNWLGALLMLYLGAVLAWGLSSSLRSKNWRLSYRLPVLLVCTHFSYFFGQCYGLLSLPLAWQNYARNKIKGDCE